jgi:UDP-N-acetylmuramate dehydrogenase
VSVFNAYMSLSGAVDADVIRGERLSHRTTYRIGGPAALFVCANTYEALLKTVEVLRAERVPWVVMGKGSNILAADTGYDGCIITLGREFSRMSFAEDDRVTAGAALPLSKLVSEAMKRSLTGLEFCAGIPGTVGGAVSMDAGTRHEWVGSVIEDVVSLQPGKGLVRHAASEVEWGYRVTSLPTTEIVLEATFRLAAGNHDAIARDVEERLRRRSQSQPMGRPCCGSVFRNPGSRSAAVMIEACGLKGYRVGGAVVSDVHANFIVNDGGAHAHDVVEVMRHVHDAVRDKYEIDLQPEVKLLGFGA